MKVRNINEVVEELFNNIENAPLVTENGTKYSGFVPAVTGEDEAYSVMLSMGEGIELADIENPKARKLKHWDLKRRNDITGETTEYWYEIVPMKKERVNEVVIQALEEVGVEEQYFFEQ